MKRINVSNDKQPRLFYFISFVWFLFFVLLPITGCSDNNGARHKEKNFIQEGDYIKFQLNGEKFKVRKEYFSGGGESKYGTLYSAEFRALLPDFEYYDKEKNHYEFVKRRGWGRKIFISLRSAAKSRSSVARIIEMHRNTGIKRFSGRLGNPDEMKYGMEVYYATKKWPDDYLYRPDGQTVVYMSCGSKIMNVPSPHCNMMWDVSDKVYMDATFSKDYLPQWQMILKKIQKLIGGKDIQGE